MRTFLAWKCPGTSKRADKGLRHGRPRMDASDLSFHQLTTQTSSAQDAPIGQTLKDTEKQTLERGITAQSQPSCGRARVGSCLVYAIVQNEETRIE